MSKKSNVKEYFLKSGKKNVKNIRALDLIEKVFPDLNYNKSLKPSHFIRQNFELIKRKFKPSASLCGSIFEYLIMCVFFRNDIHPFYYQTKLAFVPTIKYDLVLFDSKKKPIILNLKLNSGQSYKMVELESFVAKQVYKNAECNFITYYNDDLRSLEKRKDNREIQYTDNFYSAQEKEFDALIKTLSKKDYFDPGYINIVEEGIELR
tara:strand:- start:533 stop:1153 length:621 start_codon:yes stop_codon:yes gene_type:complete